MVQPSVSTVARVGLNDMTGNKTEEKETAEKLDTLIGMVIWKKGAAKKW